MSTKRFFILLAALIGIAGSAWAASPTVDNTCTAGVCFGTLASGNTSSGSRPAITTTNSSGVLLVFATAENTGSTAPVMTAPTCSVNCTGVGTFTKKRSTYNDTSTSCSGSSATVSGATELWTAPYTSTLTASQITPNYTSGVDSGVYAYMAVNGANATTPFDPNGSLPATAFLHTGTATAPSVTGISTTNADDLLVFFAANVANPTVSGVAAVSGWTKYAASTGGSGTNWESMTQQYKSVSATQSSVTVTLASNYQCWRMVVWALTADAPPATGGSLMPGWP